MKIFRVILEVLSGDSNADRVVPPSGFTARLTTLSAAAMAFLIVFVLALSLAMGRLAAHWTLELDNTSTIRISAPESQMVPQSEAVLEVLRTTPGIASARVISDAEQRKLLEPWFGPDLPIDNLPIPRLIEVLEEGSGPDFFGLKLRLSAEAPGAVLDDHTRWRRPLVIAATQLRILGLVSILLIMGSMAAMITLAAQSALAANGQVIDVLRLLGARDVYIARAFVRRFTLRAMFGAGAGTLLAMIGVLVMPDATEEGMFLMGLGFQGWHWILPFLVPPLVAFMAFWATRWAAFHTLSRVG